MGFYLKGCPAAIRGKARCGEPVGDKAVMFRPAGSSRNVTLRVCGKHFERPVQHYHVPGGRIAEARAMR